MIPAPPVLMPEQRGAMRGFADEISSEPATIGRAEIGNQVSYFVRTDEVRILRVVAQVDQASLRLVFVAMFRRQLRQDLITLFAKRVQQSFVQIVFYDSEALDRQGFPMIRVRHFSEVAICLVWSRTGYLLSQQLLR